MTRLEWCRTNGINVNTFDHRCKQVRAALGRLKNELYYGYEKQYTSFESFSIAVEKYINYYNNERIQAETKRMPPVKYREASTCA